MQFVLEWPCWGGLLYNWFVNYLTRVRVYIHQIRKRNILIKRLRKVSIYVRPQLAATTIPSAPVDVFVSRTAPASAPLPPSTLFHSLRGGESVHRPAAAIVLDTDGLVKRDFDWEQNGGGFGRRYSRIGPG